MKTKIAILGSVFTLLMSVVFILLVVFAFMQSIAIGLITISVLYIFNLIALMDTYSKRRSNTAIKKSWTLVMLLPGYGAFIYLVTGYISPLLKRKNNDSQKLQNELITKKVFKANIEIISEGSEKYRKIFEELEAAKERIYIQYFIITEGIVFKKLESILLAKAKEGIEIRILTDHIGNLKTDNKVYERLINAGIDFNVHYKGFIPFSTGKMGQRQHDKFILIDGKKAFFGGINIGDNYSHMYEKYGFWKDFHFSAEGDVVALLEEKFNCNREISTGEKLEIKKQQNLAGETDLNLLIDNPMESEKTFMNEFIRKVSKSERNIKIVSPYLIIEQKIIDELELAVNRGVKVTVITTGRADKKSAYILMKLYSQKLKELGIEVLQLDDMFMHGKFYTFDDKEFIIGTTNLDYRAIFHHYETNFHGSDKTLTKKLNTEFSEMTKNTFRDTKDSNNWGIWENFLFIIAKIFSPMM